MFTLKAFENWAVGEKDDKGEIITQQRINTAHKMLIGLHPKDIDMITLNLKPLEFEKKYFPILYAASMEVERLENTPKSTVKKKLPVLKKPREDIALALYKRNRISAESYANFCLEFFDTSVDKPAVPAKQVTTSKQLAAPKQDLVRLP
ncbi:uncharacterized protein EAE98_007600 [Botrytis deweyae]|uniref:Uncharacterized protein n=1 Tax=Botrytis deweyae TaxID=2478750 RepID=A0ABQ7IH65_9HELO|nr:uncharacterized protein EAE98_007600 [Botrytis deweyae]KAF7923782.1 hypothetical protein EAE98_007600 [Botrytis deweyae]